MLVITLPLSIASLGLILTIITTFSSGPNACDCASQMIFFIGMLLSVVVLVIDGVVAFGCAVWRLARCIRARR